jgi:hypothetical protein
VCVCVCVCVRVCVRQSPCAKHRRVSVRRHRLETFQHIKASRRVDSLFPEGKRHYGALLEGARALVSTCPAGAALRWM